MAGLCRLLALVGTLAQLQHKKQSTFNARQIVTRCDFSSLASCFSGFEGSSFEVIATWSETQDHFDMHFCSKRFSEMAVLNQLAAARHDNVTSLFGALWSKPFPPEVISHILLMSRRTSNYFPLCVTHADHL